MKKATIRNSSEIGVNPGFDTHENEIKIRTMDDKEWGGCAPDVLRDEIASALKRNGYLTAKVSVDDGKCVVHCGSNILDDELAIINRYADIVRERYGVSGHYWVRVDNGELVVWVW